MTPQKTPLTVRTRRLALLAGLAMLAACADTPPAAPQPPQALQAQKQAEARDCLPAQPRLGTTIVRREDCQPAATPEEREAARRQAEALRDEQQRSRTPRGPGG